MKFKTIITAEKKSIIKTKLSEILRIIYLLGAKILNVVSSWNVEPKIFNTCFKFYIEYS